MVIDDSEVERQANAACRTAEDFTKHYYENIDTRRHLLSKMYVDNAVLVWNGNGANGREAICKHHLDLAGTEHTLFSLDAQSVPDLENNKESRALIKVNGTVKFKDKEESFPFTQCFLIVSEDDKWKIVSDWFRLRELDN